MSEIETRHVGKSERDFVATVVTSLFPRLSILGRDFLVADVGSVDYWANVARSTLEAEAKNEQKIAQNARRGDAERGIPAWQTFRKAEDLKKRVDRFDRELAEARAQDEATRQRREAERAERQANKSEEAAS